MSTPNKPDAKPIPATPLPVSPSTAPGISAKPAVPAVVPAPKKV